MTDDEIKHWQPLIDRGVRRYARSVPRQQKEDLKQECAMEIVKAEESIRLTADDTHATKLVSRIIRNTLVDIHRKSRRIIDPISLSDPKIFREADRRDADTAPSTAKDSHLFGAAMKVLHGEQVEVLHLLVEESMTIPEIAVEMGRSKRHVDKIIREIKERLQTLRERA